MSKYSMVTNLVFMLALGCSGEEAGSKAQLQVDGQEVQCDIGTGSGNAPSPDETDAELHCEADFSNCTDGHTYQGVCDTTQGSGSTTCVCYVDGQPTDAEPFEVEGECSIDQQDILAGCGWSE